MANSKYLVVKWFLFDVSCAYNATMKFLQLGCLEAHIYLLTIEFLIELHDPPVPLSNQP